LYNFLSTETVAEQDKEYKKVLDDVLSLEINPLFEFIYLNKKNLRVDCPLCLKQGYRDSL